MIRVDSLPESKSILNRLQILASFTDQPFASFRSTAEDVLELQAALKDFRSGKTAFKVREGGTTLRFLVARVSRQPGSYQVQLGARLAARPHDDLFAALSQLGVETELSDGLLKIRTQGWQGSKVSVDAARSSQFASSLLLSSVDLPEGLQIEIKALAGSKPTQATPMPSEKRVP